VTLYISDRGGHLNASEQRFLNNIRVSGLARSAAVPASKAQDGFPLETCMIYDEMHLFR
jgi:hypothetical protein